MSNAVAEQIFLFRTLINQRRFDNGTLQILEAILVSRDVKSLLEVRSSLRELMRSESLRIIGEIAGTTVEHKLSVLEFLVRAFALTGDVESCLAFRYEALILRKFRSTSNKLLQVSCSEWMTFAKHLLDNGFYSIARKAYEHAISSFQMTGGVGTHADDFFINDEAIEKIKKLKDVAMVSSASQSVQAQAAELLKRKRMETNIELPLAGKEAKYSASNRFRDGIRKRNIRKLRDHQCIKQTISETNYGNCVLDRKTASVIQRYSVRAIRLQLELKHEGIRQKHRRSKGPSDAKIDRMIVFCLKVGTGN